MKPIKYYSTVIKLIASLISEDPNIIKESAEEDEYNESHDEYTERLRLAQATELLWSYYLGGYKKVLLKDVPHLLGGLGSRELSDGRALKVGDRASRAYRKEVQDELIEWLGQSLGRNVRDMKVYQVMRIARQYCETPQKKIEYNIKHPWQLFDDHDSWLYGPKDGSTWTDDTSED